MTSTCATSRRRRTTPPPRTKAARACVHTTRPSLTRCGNSSPRWPSASIVWKARCSSGWAGLTSRRPMEALAALAVAPLEFVRVRKALEHRVVPGRLEVLHRDLEDRVDPGREVL